MKVPAFCKISFVAFALAHTINFLAPQKAQAHHNVVHSAEQAATTAVDTAATGEAETALDTSATLPLATGAAALLGLTGFGLYNARKKQSA